MRATVNSIYTSGIALGGGLAFFLGGWIGQVHGWRWAFYLLGFPGLALAVLVFLLRERPRGATETTITPRTSSGWKNLFESRAFWLLCAGYALVGLAANNLGIWLPTFFVRVHEFSISTIGMAAGILSIVVGIPAMVSGGWLSDHIGRNRMVFNSTIALASVPLWVALLFTNNIPLLIAVNVVLYAMAIMWVGPATADVTDIAGPHARGLAIGIFFSILNIVAYGLGSPLIGKISDVLGVSTNAEQMRYSLLVCPIACALGALFLWMGSKAALGVRR
jgi:MFS family permease